MNETPVYDLASYPCFEPDCNARCATLLHREGLPLAFTYERHRRFYLAALLGQG